MATVGLNRASLFAITKEDTNGTYKAPVGSDYVPLRPSNELSFEPEKLESDEFLNDIGATKSALGKEAVSGSHSAYLKHSGVEGVAPELGVLYESVMGGSKVATVEYALLAGSTTTILKVADGTKFIQGQSLLVKKADGYEVRNIDSIVGNDLILNFALSSAPIAGVLLGKAVTYIPQADGHPTFSTTKNISNGFAKEISAGNTATEISLTMDANGYAEVSFSFAGTKYAFNPIEINSTNKYLDFVDDSGTYSLVLAEKLYSNPIDLGIALENALNATSSEDYTVKFNSTSGKFAIKAVASAVFEILFVTGTNAANNIGASLGFAAADLTGATEYVSDNAQTYEAKVSPSYDDDNKIVVKGAELFIGNQDDNLCVCAQSVSLTISKEVEDVDCICEESGVLEKIPTGRTAELSVTASLKKHDVTLLEALLKNSDVSAMFNAGSKAGGNVIAGKGFNFYMQKATVSQFKTTGDSFAQVEITLSGFVTTKAKDIYLNFV